MASFEVCGDNGPVFFLAGGVPDIQFGGFIFKVDIFDFEVDGGDLGIFFCQELSFGESPKQGCLADIAIAYDNDFVAFLIFVC